MERDQDHRELTARVAALEFAVAELFRIVHRSANVPAHEIENVQSRMIAVAKRWRPPGSGWDSNGTLEGGVHALLDRVGSYRDFYDNVGYPGLRSPL